MSEELKKEWEIKFDKLFDHIATFGVNAGRQEYKSFISSLLAKQQEGFVKKVERLTKLYTRIEGNTPIAGYLSDVPIYIIPETSISNLLADIKSKLNI